MIIKPKTEKKSCPIRDIKVYEQGGRIKVTGAGYLNLRRVYLMTAENDPTKCYFLDNNKGFTVGFDKNVWGLSIDDDNNNKKALKPFIDCPNIKTGREIVPIKDGRKEFVTYIKAENPQISLPKTAADWNALIEMLTKETGK